MILARFFMHYQLLTRDLCAGMTVDMTETEIEIGWITAMIEAAAPEHAVEAEVQSANVIVTGFVNGIL